MRDRGGMSVHNITASPVQALPRRGLMCTRSWKTEGLGEATLLEDFYVVNCYWGREIQKGIIAKGSGSGTEEYREGIGLKCMYENIIMKHIIMCD